MAPSVTPSTGGGPNNPGLRLYKFETNTGQVGGGGVAGAYTSLIISGGVPRNGNALFARRTDFKSDAEM